MSTTQCLQKVRQPESMKSLVARIPVKEGQKLSPVKEILGYSWEEFQRFVNIVGNLFESILFGIC